MDGPVAAAGAAPAAPASPAPAPSAPAAPSPAPAAFKPAGYVRASNASARETSAEVPQAPTHEREATPPGAPPPRETQTQQAARLERLRTAAGEEVEVDVADLIAKHEAGIRRKMKIDGQERDVSLAEMAEAYPLAKASMDRFRAASEATKKVEETRAALRDRVVAPLAGATKNPAAAFDVLSEIMGGQDAAIAFMEQTLKPIYERDALPADQKQRLSQYDEQEKRLRTERAEIERQRSEMNGQQEAQKVARVERLTRQEFERYQRDVPILLRSVAEDIARETGAEAEEITPDFIAQWARLRSEADDQRIPLDDRQIARQVLADHRALIEKRLGPLAQKQNREAIERVRSSPQRAPTQARPPVQQQARPVSLEAFARDKRAADEAAGREYSRTGRWPTR